MRKRVDAPILSPAAEAAREQLKLVRKLRWIGQDEEAKRLLGALPKDERASPITQPVCTD